MAGRMGKENIDLHSEDRHGRRLTKTMRYGYNLNAVVKTVLVIPSPCCALHVNVLAASLECQKSRYCRQRTRLCQNPSLRFWRGSATLDQ
jgi:hypothetical protein